jgi:hypothetical protein
MATKRGHTGGMTASPTDAAIATLRIEIKYIEPLIWRRVAVRTSMNLRGLHTVIQASVGWLDYHLWEFLIDGANTVFPIPTGLTLKTVQRPSSPPFWRQK